MTFIAPDQPPDLHALLIGIGLAVVGIVVIELVKWWLS